MIRPRFVPRAPRRGLGAVGLAASLALVGVSCGGGPSGAVDAALARLSFSQDLVEAKTTEEFRTAVLGEPYEQGHEVQTRNPGLGEVTYRDGSVTRLDYDTHLTVSELASGPDAPDVRVTLDAGRAWNRVRDIAEAGGRYEFEGTVGLAAVRGTAFDVDCRDAALGCVFTAVEGSIEITGDAGGPASLTAPQRVSVAPDGAVGAVEDLEFAAVAADPWIARNLALDAQRGFPALVQPDGQVAPPLGPDDQPLAPGSFEGASEVRAAEAVVAADGVITQRVVVGGPTRVALAWSFCNGQTCGTSENAECVVNQYIPSYAGALTTSISISPLQGYELQRAALVVGDSPLSATSTVVVTPDAVSGASDAFSEPPRITEGGGLTLSLSHGGLEQTLRRLPNFPGRACGVSEEQRDAILAEYGPTPEVPGAYVELELTWVPASEGALAALAGTTQTVSTAFGERALTIPPLVVPAAAPAEAPTYSQGDGEWASLLVPNVTATPITPPTPGAPTEPPTETPPPEQFLNGVPGPGAVPFSQVGTVPTAFANALARLGVEATPGEVGATLLANGAWQPGRGTNPTPLGVGAAAPTDVTTVLLPAEVAATVTGGVQSTTTPLTSALRGVTAGDGAAYVVGLAPHAGAASAVVLTGYDAASDSVTVHHPALGELVLPVSDVTSRLQFVLRLSLGANPSRAALL